MDKRIELLAKWREAKAIEKKAIEERRNAEDELVNMFAIDKASEGTSNVEYCGFKIKVTTRFNHKINSQQLQELATEHGLDEMLGYLFRWKPEIDMKAWKAASPEITSKLAPAITTDAGRPSFTITHEEDSNETE